MPLNSPMRYAEPGTFSEKGSKYTGWGDVNSKLKKLVARWVADR